MKKHELFRSQESEYETDPLKSKITLYLGRNGVRIILIYPLLAIFFMYFFDQMGYLYSTTLTEIFNDFGIRAQLTSHRMSEELWLLAGYQEYFIALSNDLSAALPILMIQKIQFVVIMLSIALGLHVSPQKKLNYLLIAPAYWGFVMAQDIVAGVIIGTQHITPDVLTLGSFLIITSSYVGSIIFLYTVFRTSNLPPPVMVIPKIKRDSKKYYYVLGLTVVSTFGIFQLLLPLFQYFEYNISVAVLALTMFNVFKLSSYLIGYAFSSFDKPVRLTSYIPLVSVLIPARNEEKNIGRAIDCVEDAAAFYKGKVELIIVNDKSIDRTPEICEEKIRDSKSLTGKVILGPGKGKSSAMNLALSEAQGELTLNLDADMTITKDTISELVPYFVDPEVGGVGCHVEQRNELGLLRKMFAIDLLFIFGLVKPGQQGFDSIMVIIGGASMYRKKILQEIGGWGPVKTGDDGDMTLRVARYGYKIIQYRKKTVAHSEIFADLPRWFIQRTRWYMGFFYTHARNRDAVRMHQGIRGMYQMPMVYAGSFTRFTTLLHTELILIMALASFFYFGLSDVDVLVLFAVALNPMLIVLIGLCLFYKKARIIPYFIMWPIYSYLQLLTSFRALTIVMGEETWQTRATLDEDVVKGKHRLIDN